MSTFPVQFKSRLARQIPRAHSQGYNLFQTPLIGRWLKSRRVLFGLRCLMLLILFCIIGFGFAVPSVSENYVSKGLAWGVFWPFFILVSMPTVGAVFCGICPHGFIGEWLTGKGLQKPVPASLKHPAIGLSLLLAGYWAILYLYPGTIETPHYIAGLFTITTLMAVLGFATFNGMAYCKYWCPIGAIIRAFSKMAFLRLGTDLRQCASCRSFDCAKACHYKLQPFNFDRYNMMQDCTLCMKCAQACDSVEWRVTTPASQLLGPIQKTRRIDIAVYLVMLAVISVTMLFHHALGRTGLADQLPWIASGRWLNARWPDAGFDAASLFALLYALLLTFSVALLGFSLAAHILRLPFSDVIQNLGYSLAPLMVIGALSHVGEQFFVHYVPDAGNAVLQLIGSDRPPFEGWLPRNTPFLRLFMLFNYVAVFWSWYLLYRRMQLVSATATRKWLAAPFAASVSLMMLGLQLFTLYAFVAFGNGHTHH